MEDFLEYLQVFVKRNLQNNCKFFPNLTLSLKVLSILFMQNVNKYYCNEIGMDDIKSVSFFSFRLMIVIQILGGGVSQKPSRGNQSKERLTLFKNRLKW